MPQAPPICGVSYREIVPSGRKNGCNRYHDARPLQPSDRAAAGLFRLLFGKRGQPF